jgi:hypothetical protein
MQRTKDRRIEIARLRRLGHRDSGARPAGPGEDGAGALAKDAIRSADLKERGGVGRECRKRAFKRFARAEARM